MNIHYLIRLLYFTDNTEKTHTHVQGGLHDTAISKPENNNEGAISTNGDSPQKAGCCLEAHLGDGLVQTTSKQILNSNEKRKMNFRPGNKEVQVSTEAGACGSSHTRDNSVVEIKPARIRFFQKSSVSCSRSNCSTLGNTNINIDHQNEDPECPEVKNTDLAGNSEERDQKRISPNRSSLQNSEECKETENGSSLNSSGLKDEKKKRKKRRKGIKNNNRNTNTSQDSPLPTGTDTSDLMTMVAENNTPGLKRMGLGGKQNQNDVAMTKSFAVDNAMMTEGKSVNVDGTIEKKYGVVQPCSFEEKETENVAKLLGSCMLDCNKVTSTNVSSVPLQGVRVGPNVNTNGLHSTSEEKVCQIAVGEGFTKPFGVVSRPYSSEENLISQSAKHKREAILHPSFISGVIENGLKILPPEDQSYRLDPFNEGANFFQLGNAASNGGSDVRHGINILESGAMGNSEYELGRSYLECAITEKNKLQKKEVAFLSTDHIINCISPSSSAQAYKEKLKIAFSPRRSLTGFQKKKLLILDLNGLLADINQDYHNARIADAKVRGKLGEVTCIIVHYL